MACLTSIGARLDPVLPLSPGRAERHGFEYFRDRTLSLYAALEVSSGQVSPLPNGRDAHTGCRHWSRIINSAKSEAGDSLTEFLKQVVTK